MRAWGTESKTIDLGSNGYQLGGSVHNLIWDDEMRSLLGGCRKMLLASITSATAMYCVLPMELHHTSYSLIMLRSHCSVLADASFFVLYAVVQQAMPVYISIVAAVGHHSLPGPLRLC